MKALVCYRARIGLIITVGLCWATVGLAQSGSPATDGANQQPEQPVAAQVRPNQAGRVADSLVGEVGQRQTRERAVPGVNPIARLNTRVTNRIQSRLRTRIDRYYDPQLNSTDAFVAAEAEIRRAGSPRGR